MKQEISALSPNTSVAVSLPFQRENATWLGGALLTGLSSFANMCISRSEYEEYGGVIVHRKCF